MPSNSTNEFIIRSGIRAQEKKLAARERGRQSRSVVRARSKAKKEEAAQRAQLSVEAAQRREDIRTAASQQRAALKAQAKASPPRSRASRVTGAAGATVGAVGTGVSKASDYSVGQVFLLVLSIMGGLIIFYLFVTRPNTTNLRSQQLSGWLNLFSTDSPLFVKVPPTKSVGPTVKPGSTTGSTSSGGSNVA